jgi:hypothetical protein
MCYHYQVLSVRHVSTCCWQSLEVPLSYVRVTSGPHTNEVLSNLGPQPSCLGSQSSHSGRLGTEPHEEDPTIVAMASYLLALDSLRDQQCTHARSMIGCAELIKRHWHKSRVELAKYEARAVHAES